MAKCRSLLQENQELGKQISQGRVAQLEAEIALQKKYNQEIKATQEGLIFFFFSPSFLTTCVVIIGYKVW